MEQNNKHNWTAYFYILAAVVCSYIARDVAGEANGLVYRVILTPVFAIVPIAGFHFLTNHKDETGKRNWAIALSIVLLATMVVVNQVSLKI